MNRQTTPLRFMTNRIVRIVPLYWLLTLTVAAACLLAPHFFRGVVLTPDHVLKSLFFIPHFYPGMPSRIWPLLLPGWTLNYEMVFYLVFAVALLLPRRLMIPLIGACSPRPSPPASSSISTVRSGLFYTESLIMEFVAGMMLGHLWLHGRLKMPTLPALSVIPVAFMATDRPVAVRGAPDPVSCMGRSGHPDRDGVAVAGPARAVHLQRVSEADGGRLVLHLPDAYPHAGRAADGVERLGWSSASLTRRLSICGVDRGQHLVGIAVYYLVEVPLLRFFRRSGRRARAPLPAGARAVRFKVPAPGRALAKSADA